MRAQQVLSIKDCLEAGERRMSGVDDRVAAVLPAPKRNGEITEDYRGILTAAE